MPVAARAQRPVAESNFLVRTTGDLLTLCAS